MNNFMDEADLLPAIPKNGLVVTTEYGNPHVGVDYAARNLLSRLEAAGKVQVEKVKGPSQYRVTRK